MSIHFSTGKTNCLTYTPKNINLTLDPLNVTVVGSPTINNGVASGLTSGNYVKTPNQLNLTTANDWEIVIKYTHLANGSLRGFCGLLTGDNIQCNFYITDNNTVQSDGVWGNLESSTSLMVGITYWTKLQFTGSQYILSLSTNGQDFINQSVINSTAKVSLTQGFAFGCDRATSSINGTASIDLSQSYIKINGSTWWKGGTGRLTLKKGSKVYVPNGKNTDGSNKFDEVVIESDLSYTEKADTTCLLYYSPNKKSILRRGAGSLTGYSGLEANKVTNGAYYATDTNFLYSVTSSGEEKISLPLAMIASTTAASITSISQIFDWCGYIGSTTFVLPGVKFLAPSGFNNDGSYKNEEWESKYVSTQTVTTAYSNQPLVVQNVSGSYYVNYLGELTTTPAVQQYRGYYNKTENKNYFASTTDKWEQRFFVPCALTSRTTNGVVTSLTPYSVKTTNDSVKIKDTGAYGVYFGSPNTNCLTYTPKNVNLTLSNGTLTLKKGSKVYVPSGFDAVRYYKYTYAEWTQPVLTADGVLGGDDFAVFCDSPNNTSYPAYYAFDSSTSTFAVTHEADYIIYNKNPINITKIDMTVRGSSYNYRGGTLYGSNDNSSWKEIIALSALTNGSWDISSNTGYYKYYKFSGSAGDWQPKTLTLTATQQTGSVESTSTDYDYTVGTGQMKFDEVVIANDLSHTASTYGSDIHFSCLSPNKNQIQSLIKGTQVFSGNTAPTVGYTYAFWYDTANNFVKFTIDGGVIWESGWSLPFAIDSIINGTGYTSIDQTFDWCGYIGSTAFVLPGVKGLIPNGFNADGTYKSVEFETNKVLLNTYNYQASNQIACINDVSASIRFAKDIESTQQPTWAAWISWYNPQTNKRLNTTGQESDGWSQHYAVNYINSVTTDSSFKITSLTPYTAQSATTVIPIKEIYNGSQLVYKFNSFSPNSMVVSQAGDNVSRTIKLGRGVYEIVITAGGGLGKFGAYNYAFYGQGGSGASIYGAIYIPEDTTITYYAGMDNQSASSSAYGYSSYIAIGGTQILTASGGQSGWDFGNHGKGGTATNNLSASKIQNISLTFTNGVAGGSGGTSVDPDGTWGEGGRAGNLASDRGEVGRVAIRYLRYDK